jgi:hypothetical protein
MSVSETGSSRHFNSVGKLAGHRHEVARPCGRHAHGGNTLPAQPTIAHHEHARPAKVLVGHDRRLAELSDGSYGRRKIPGQREAIDQVTVHAVLKRHGLLHVAGIANGHRHELHPGAAFLEKTQDLLLTAVNVELRVRPARTFL